MEKLTRAEGVGHRVRLQQEGKIARFGASVESVAEADELPEPTRLRVAANHLQIFRQTPATSGLLDRCQEAGRRDHRAAALASGCSREVHAGHTVAPEDHRTNNRNGEKFNVGETFAGLGFETGLRWSRS